MVCLIGSCGSREVAEVAGCALSPSTVLYGAPWVVCAFCLREGLLDEAGAKFQIYSGGEGASGEGGGRGCLYEPLDVYVVTYSS